MKCQRKLTAASKIVHGKIMLIIHAVHTRSGPYPRGLRYANIKRFILKHSQVIFALPARFGIISYPNFAPQDPKASREKFRAIREMR
jgi:hypothetical protein